MTNVKVKIKRRNAQEYIKSGIMFDTATGVLSYDIETNYGRFASTFSALIVDTHGNMRIELDDDEISKYDSQLSYEDTTGYVALKYKDITKVTLPNNDSSLNFGIFSIQDISGEGSIIYCEGGYESYFITLDKLKSLKRLTILEDYDDNNDFSKLKPTYKNNTFTGRMLNFDIFATDQFLPNLKTFTTNSIRELSIFKTNDCVIHILEGTLYLTYDHDVMLKYLEENHQNYHAYISYLYIDSNGTIIKK